MKRSVRDQWYAFYSIYRACMKFTNGDIYVENGLKDALCVLFARYAGLSVVLNQRDPEIRKDYPIFLRKRLHEMDVRKRLRYPKVEWLEKITDKLADQGILSTPSEVAETRAKIIKLMREKGAEKGIDLPADDEEMLGLLRKSPPPTAKE